MTDVDSPRENPLTKTARRVKTPATINLLDTGLPDRSARRRSRTLLVCCVGLLVMTALSGCIESRKYIETTCAKMPGDTVDDRDAAVQCQKFRQAEAATAVYNEAAQLLKSYRACLERYEQTPARAKEICALYAKALQDIGLRVREGEVSEGLKTEGASTRVK